MNDDLIKRSDAIEAIHNYWKKRLETLPTKESEYGEVYADIQQLDKILEYNKALCNFIKSIPSADRPQGKWKVKSFHECFCNNCGFSFDVMKCEFLENMKYCPNCGVPKGADDEVL